METFDALDGTRLAVHRLGTGRPLICLPGGPMQASAYLGDLGGLSARRTLIRPDLRGTGDSAAPADPATYRVDRQVGDVEALAAHAGVSRFDLLAHSAGATLALLYAARHPNRIDRLVLVNPSPRPVDVAVTGDDRLAVAGTRRGEPWFPDAFAALERIASGRAGDGDGAAITPFLYGRWDDDTRRYAARQDGQRNLDAARAYYAGDPFDPAAVRSALAGRSAPVLLVAGERDLQLPPHRAAEYAALFPAAELEVLPGGGHFAWRDQPDRFVRAVTAFLDR